MTVTCCHCPAFVTLLPCAHNCCTSVPPLPSYCLVPATAALLSCYCCASVRPLPLFCPSNATLLSCHCQASVPQLTCFCHATALCPPLPHFCPAFALLQCYCPVPTTAAPLSRHCHASVTLLPCHCISYQDQYSNIIKTCTYYTGKCRYSYQLLNVS